MKNFYKHIDILVFPACMPAVLNQASCYSELLTQGLQDLSVLRIGIVSLQLIQMRKQHFIAFKGKCWKTIANYVLGFNNPYDLGRIALLNDMTQLRY